LKKLLVLDFDGVIHSYNSGWQGAGVIPDPPVPLAMEFLAAAVEQFKVSIFSSRSSDPEGVRAMMLYVRSHLTSKFGHQGDLIANMIDYPVTKPPAFLTIDDRALTFDGTWPDVETLKSFKPWNMKKG
jgi:hypothetical protein